MKVSQSFRKYNVASFDIMNFHGLLSFVVITVKCSNSVCGTVTLVKIP